MKNLIVLLFMGLFFNSCSFDDIAGHDKHKDKDNDDNTIMYVVKAPDGTDIFYRDSVGDEIFVKLFATVSGGLGSFSKKVIFNKNIKYNLRIIVKTDTSETLRMSIINNVIKTDTELNLKYNPLKTGEPPSFQEFTINLSENFNTFR